MRSLVLSLLVAILVSGAVPALGADQEVTPGLGGLVRSDLGPLDSARVYAYQVTDLQITRATTDQNGRFLFSTLPAGVYKVIAHKVGFVPAIVLFTRATQTAADFLEFELIAEQTASDQDTEDFWSIRRRVPGDVLREIEVAEAMQDAEQSAIGDPASGLAFETEMMAGLDDNASAGLSQLTSGRFGLQGRVGRLLLELDGRFDQLRPDSAAKSTDLPTQGRTNTLDLSVASGASGAVQFSGVRHTLDHHPMMAKAVDLERYQVGWRKGMRSGAESEVSAQYFSESGFHSQGMVKPAGLPDGSRTLNVNGSYRQEVGERMAVRTGVGYQEMLLDTQLGNTLPGLVRQRVNAFGIGSTDVGRRSARRVRALLHAARRHLRGGAARRCGGRARQTNGRWTRSPASASAATSPPVSAPSASPTSGTSRRSPAPTTTTTSSVSRTERKAAMRSGSPRFTAASATPCASSSPTTSSIRSRACTWSAGTTFPSSSSR